MPVETKTLLPPPPDLPKHWHAANFAILKIGTVSDGITSEHVCAAGSYLASQGIEGVALVAGIAQAYGLLVAKQQSTS